MIEIYINWMDRWTQKITLVHVGSLVTILVCTTPPKRQCPLESGFVEYGLLSTLLRSHTLVHRATMFNNQYQLSPFLGGRARNYLRSTFQGFLLLFVSAFAAPNYPKEAPSSPGISYEPVQHKKVKQVSQHVESTNIKDTLFFLRGAHLMLI